ncbi:MAG: hypothetical protein IPL79_10915 [Myxococcales bacterium]|nr:hypothetical protein [Myxococcales bacterium]
MKPRQLVALALLLLAACGPKDPDGTPTPSSYDGPDSDGDTLTDAEEGTGDFDGDGTPNAQDLDSDNDGYPDAEEAGDANPSTPAVDTDGDGATDPFDLDSDADGLSDARELELGTGRTSQDTDGDGFSDLVEVTLHEQCVLAPDDCNGDPDPLDPSVGVSVDDFVFILPYEDAPQTKPLTFATDVSRADVQFSMDTTGSMGGEIDALKTGLQSIITQISAPGIGVPDAAFGVSRFEDVPQAGYGGGTDRPFRLHQRITTIASEAQTGVQALTLGGGNDTPESGWEALYQIATGAGLGAWVPAFAPLSGYVAAKHGLLGGVGFREAALPIVVQIGDAAWHHSGTTTVQCQGGSLLYSGVAGAVSRVAAKAALTDKGIRAIGIASNEFPAGDPCGPRTDMRDVASETGAVVQPSAWNDPGFGGRPAGCSNTQCCTGLNGVGQTPSSLGCPLVFEVSASGGGDFVNQIVQAVRILVNYAVFDLSSQPRGTLQATAEGAMIDPAGFISSITPLSISPAPPGGMQVDSSGQIILQVQPGVQATFEVVAQNTFVPGAAEAQVFVLKIVVLGDTVAVLDTRHVVIIVPPAGTQIF